jgi:chitin disaccharide deacetylase
MKTLIINADDMGVSPHVNRAIVALYKASAITGTSIISPGEAFAEACCSLKENGIEEVGAHLTLTGNFRPVTLKGEGMKSFMARNGRFPKNYILFALGVFLGKIGRKELKNELIAQIEKVLEQGLTLTHLDSHEHVHMLPEVWEIALELCAEFSIPYIRIPLETLPSNGSGSGVKDVIRSRALRFFSKSAHKRLSGTSVRVNDMFLGHVHSGKLNGDVLSFMADNIAEGITELAIHPADNSPELFKEFPWYRNGPAEIKALMSEKWKNKLNEQGVTTATHSEAFEKPPRR